MTIANPPIHVICGSCGSNKEFSFRIEPKGNCTKDGTEYPAVFISCANCSNLTGLDDVIPEERKQTEEVPPQGDQSMGRIHIVDELTEELVGGDMCGHEACYSVSDKEIIIRRDAKVSVLEHELGHHIIEMNGGGCAEQEMYDDLDCEGLGFDDFARRVDAAEFRAHTAETECNRLRDEISNIKSDSKKVLRNQRKFKKTVRDIIKDYSWMVETYPHISGWISRLSKMLA